jgi:hypothetical protein
MITTNEIAGSLDIVWMNSECRLEAPVYFLHFLPYRGLNYGAQKCKEIVGKDGLKTYLQQLGFTLLSIYGICGEIERTCSVDLNNVMMNEYEYAMTYRN